MSKRRLTDKEQTDSENPLAPGSDLNIVDQLAAGRTPEEIVKNNLGISFERIETAKQQILYAARHFSHNPYSREYSPINAHLRIRHLIVVLHPHPIVDMICHAFEDVRLGKAASIRQLRVMSNYGEDESGRPLSDYEFAQLRNLDETNNWRALKIEDIERYPSFSFCDAEGFRFYLPARMIADLVSCFGLSEVLFDLIPKEYGGDKCSWYISRYALLNDLQQHAVATALWYGLSAPPTDYSVPRKEMEEALEAFWLPYLELPPESE